MLTAIVALWVANRQQARQRRYEKWVRVLNGYQNFHTEGEKYLAFLERGQDQLAADALKSVYKSAYDIRLLDPFGQDRAGRMLNAADTLPSSQTDVTRALRDHFTREATGVYRDFEEDDNTARWAGKPDRRARRPF